MSLRDQLQDIYERRGVLNPEVVLEEARPKTHPLHDRFEWDNQAAGEAWRRHQAHELIQSVKIAYVAPTGAPSSIRAFHAIRHEDGGWRYEPIGQVAQDPVLTELVRREMERDWRQLKARYEQFDEFRQLVIGDLAVAS